MAEFVLDRPRVAAGRRSDGRRLTWTRGDIAGHLFGFDVGAHEGRHRVALLVGGLTDPSVLDWLFRNRRTGEFTVAQTPNAALVVSLTAWAGRRLLHPTGSVDTALATAAAGALIYWAVDELVRGVNPWRRILGAGVLIWRVASLLSR